MDSGSEGSDYSECSEHHILKQVKLSHYRPEQAHRVPGLGLQIS
jgi:hypothetical protein